jgi:hypothetical protein
MTCLVIRRAYSPVLRSADLPADTTVPLVGRPPTPLRLRLTRVNTAARKSTLISAGLGWLGSLDCPHPAGASESDRLFPSGSRITTWRTPLS